MTDKIGKPSLKNIRKVGEEFIFEDVKLVTIQGKGCAGCYFDKNCMPEFFESHGFCGKSFREDKISVIFKKVKS